MPDAPARFRFQFTLRDLVCVTLSAGAALGLLLPQFLKGFAARGSCRPSYPNCPECCSAYWKALACVMPLAAAAAVGGAGLGLLLAHKWRLTGLRKAVALALFPFAGWIACLGYEQFHEGLLRSRIRGYETLPIAACKTYAEAQDIYRRTDWDGNGVLEYAIAIKGNYSLFERAAGSEDLQLVDQAFAKAEYDPVRGTVVAPKAGYIFKVLTGQGPGAPGGGMSYLQQGPDGKVRMAKGYALVACPYAYHLSGHYTYIINQSGIVYQKDLGLDTFEVFKQMTEYDPSSHGGWRPCE